MTSWCRVSMLTVGQEHRDTIEIGVGWDLYAATFSANGEYVFSGGWGGVRVWRVQDRDQLEEVTMEARGVLCLAVSGDGKWIAAGTSLGDVVVWDAETYKPASAHKGSGYINGVDFSPDSTRLISASDNRTATVWDVATGAKIQTLFHEDSVIAARYSPHGDRVATATSRSVHVHDSGDGRLLVDITVNVIPLFNTGLLWFNNYLLVVSDSQIKQFEASTGSAVSEWPASDTDESSCIALPKHGGFVACSAKRTVTFWDTLTHTQLGLIQHPQDILLVALSSDDQFVAIGGEGIVIESLSPIVVSSTYCWIAACFNNSTAKSCHTMLGICWRARTTKRAAFDIGRLRQQTTRPSGISSHCHRTHRTDLDHGVSELLFAPMMYAYRIQSHYPVYTPLFRNQTFISTTLPSIYGSRTSSQTWRRS